MDRASLFPIKKGYSLVSTAIATGFAVGFLLNSPMFAGASSNSGLQLDTKYISQNIVADQVNLETIYVAEEGINLGWIIRIGNFVVAVDASGSPIRILSRAVNNSGGSTAEYYTSGVARDKPKRIGNIYFQYYNNAGIELGKIRSIGNLYFQYYNNGGLENGKIKFLGNIPFQYYNAGVNGVKIKSIGNVNFIYDSNWNMQRISGTQPDVDIQTLSIEQWRAIVGRQEPTVPLSGF
jgi:hypothetical protein